MEKQSREEMGDPLERFGHEHPLQLLMLAQTQVEQEQEQEQEQSSLSLQEEKPVVGVGVGLCSRCGEEVSALPSADPSYRCSVEECGFYIHKKCGDAPLELNHPLHRDHPILLLHRNSLNYTGNCVCDFCFQICKELVYHCSCGLDFHINCALFTSNIARKNLQVEELQHVPLVINSTTSKMNDDDDDLGCCFGCWEPLTKSTYFSLDHCGFKLHQKCADLPIKINNRATHKHPLLLQFNGKRLPCSRCGLTQRRGFVYKCLHCKFALHIQCLSSSELSQRGLCSRCGEEVLPSQLSADDPSSVEQCGSYVVHKECGDAPSELNYPFHRNHPLLLLHQNSLDYLGGCVCDFCHQICDRFVYHCSDCGLDFHIKCALFTSNIAHKNLQDLQHFPLVNSTTSEINDDHLGCCFGCWEPLTKSTYFSVDHCGFKLHQKCAELPIKINNRAHRKHPLLLQFNSQHLPCSMCGDTQGRGFVYTCLPCKFALHIQCALYLPDSIEDTSHHQHPFTLFWRQTPFICDACGKEGNCAAYVCCTCDIMAHKKCISLPRFIKHIWHGHRLSHTYFLHQDHEEDFESWDCIICHDEVNPEHGSYCCSRCKVIVHVNCTLEDERFYQIVSSGDGDEEDLPPLPPGEPIDAITCVLERNDRGEATKITHVKHMHNLILGDKLTPTLTYDQNKYYCCDGCAFPISLPSASFYYCSEYHCDFFLHQACAEFPNLKLWWKHSCKEYLRLTSGYLFQCDICEHISNGFGYKCKKCFRLLCLRCAIIDPTPLKCPGHDEHPLLFYHKFDGNCDACGDKLSEGYHCKLCKFTLDYKCATQPIVAHHKIDHDHLLALTYRDNNDYSISHYCDICEERRDQRWWFYRCATCDTSAHVACVIGKHRPAIKPGLTYKDGEDFEIHPHPLTFVKKMYYYPKCDECGEPCQDLALECAKPGCNFIVHLTCILPRWWRI